MNFSALQKALLAGEAVNLDGASGPLDFDPATGDVTGVIELWKVDGDSFSTVERWRVDGDSVSPVAVVSP